MHFKGMPRRRTWCQRVVRACPWTCLSRGEWRSPEGEMAEKLSVTSLLTASFFCPRWRWSRLLCRGGCTRLTGERFLTGFVKLMLQRSREVPALRRWEVSRCQRGQEPRRAGSSRGCGTAPGEPRALPLGPRRPRELAGEMPFRYQGARGRRHGPLIRANARSVGPLTLGWGTEMSALKWSASHAVGAWVAGTGVSCVSWQSPLNVSKRVTLRCCCRQKKIGKMNAREILAAVSLLPFIQTHVVVSSVSFGFCSSSHVIIRNTVLACFYFTAGCTAVSDFPWLPAENNLMQIINLLPCHSAAGNYIQMKHLHQSLMAASSVPRFGWFWKDR